MSDVFKLALPGNDAKDAPVGQLVIDSDYPNPKVDTLAAPPHAGIISLNWSSSLVIAKDTTKLLYSFNHGYDYVPTVIASYTFDNGSVRTGGVLPLFIGVLGLITVDADDTKVNLKYFSTDLASTTIPPFISQIRFYVFAERGF